jgi:precorrin-8X/cobalt-precorrin-8 methylmutase
MSPEVGPLLRRHGLPPAEIEALSRQRILDQLGARLPSGEPARSLAARLVYAVGDPALADRVRMSDDAVGAAVAALGAGGPIVVDVGMVAAGLSREAVGACGGRVLVAIKEAGVAAAARERRITRTAAGMLLLGARLDGAVVAVGNAPTALLAVLDMVAGGIARPAAVIGMPVGFVAAAESKAELARSGLPFVTVLGTRGGSPLAAAALNHLARLAASSAPDGVDRRAAVETG